MGLTEVRPYFRARMNALNYREWEDAFGINNIPDTIINGAYHISSLETSSVSLNQNDLRLDTTMEVRLFLKGYRTPKDALDNAAIKMDAIFVEVLKPSNRVTGSGGLRNVLFIDSTIEPLNELTNDNAIIIRMRFNCQVNIDVC